MFRTGFVAIVGRPNVGKSTLLNRLVGQKVASTSGVAQTTRHRIKGIVTTEKGQVIFVDTPGFSKALDPLGNFLVQEGMAAIEEADIYMAVMDFSVEPGKGDAWLLSQLTPKGKFILLVLNKADLVKSPEKRQKRLDAYKALLNAYPDNQVLLVSAQTGKNTDSLSDTLIRKLPEGPALYEADMMTDQRLRDIAAECLREKVMRHTLEEIPHSVAAVIEQYDEQSQPGKVRILATLYVEQDSQKGILIGKAGQMIKKLGTETRQDLEELTGCPVFLDLRVRVKKNWRKDADFLAKHGLAAGATAG